MKSWHCVLVNFLLPSAVPNQGPNFRRILPPNIGGVSMTEANAMQPYPRSGSPARKIPRHLRTTPSTDRDIETDGVITKNKLK